MESLYLSSCISYQMVVKATIWRTFPTGTLDVIYLANMLGFTFLAHVHYLLNYLSTLLVSSFKIRWKRLPACASVHRSARRRGSYTISSGWLMVPWLPPSLRPTLNGRATSPLGVKIILLVCLPSLRPSVLPSFFPYDRRPPPSVNPLLRPFILLLLQLSS